MDVASTSGERLPENAVTDTKKRRRTCFSLPENGVHDERGYLFYHTAVRRLDHNGKQRLEEFGIQLRSSNFSSEEDVILQNNWRHFADEYDLKDEEAAYLAGLNAKPTGRGIDERLLFIQKTQFYPKMCDGLDNRTAEKIMWRMRDLFDPIKLANPNDQTRAFSKEEDGQLMNLYKKGMSCSNISQEMRKPLARIKSRIKYFRKSGLDRERVQPFSESGDHHWNMSFTEHNLPTTFYPMPQSGILNDKGILFHHVYPRKFSAENITRLREHGIIVEPFVFSNEEDKKLKDNWKRYATTNKIPYNLAAYLAGWESYMKGYIEKEGYDLTTFPFLKTTKDRHLFLERTGFWPKMCHGMATRSAYSVQHRMIKIFDPVVLDGNYETIWTPDDYETMDRLYRLTKSKCKVAYRMNRPFCDVRFAVTSYVKRVVPIRFNERRKLWTIIDRYTGGGAREAVMSEITSGQSAICIKDISLPMVRTDEIVSKAWNEIVDDFRTGLALKSFDEVFDDVIPEALRISGDQFSDFIHLLVEYFPEVKLRTLRIPPASRFRMERAMLRMGIVGFQTTFMTELRYCLKRTQLVVRSICSILNYVTDLTEYGSLDVLKVIAQCYAQLEEARPGRKSGLKTTHFVTVLFTYMEKHHPGWEPPKKLKRWLKKTLKFEEEKRLNDGRKNKGSKNRM